MSQILYALTTQLLNISSGEFMPTGQDAVPGELPTLCLTRAPFVTLLSESACIVANDPNSPAQPTILSLNGINSPFIDNNYTSTNVTVVSQFFVFYRSLS